MGNEKMIAIENLTYFYRGAAEPVLRGITLRIRPGESLSIMGANGSGKSTLARCVNGLLPPPPGSVSVDGLDPADEGEVEKIRRRVGMVFQNPDNQIVGSTVERELAFGLENLGVPAEEMHRRVEAFLEEFHLEPYRKRSPHYLSGGEKQLLALASVLIMRPRYLILDEPTSLLDPQWRRRILRKIFGKSSGQMEGITPVLITQFPDETFYTSRLVVLDKGRVIADGRPEEVFGEAERLLRCGVAVPPEFQIRDLLPAISMETYFANEL